MNISCFKAVFERFRGYQQSGQRAYQISLKNDFGCWQRRPHKHRFLPVSQTNLLEPWLGYFQACCSNQQNLLAIWRAGLCQHIQSNCVRGFLLGQWHYNRVQQVLWQRDDLPVPSARNQRFIPRSKARARLLQLF